MKKAIIISAGIIKDYTAYSSITVQDEDLVVCADGGYEHCINLGFKPDIVIGDFDSNRQDIPAEVEKIKYPREKDFTDTHMAVTYALEAGYREFYLLGCLGGRLDHTLANLALLKYLDEQGASGILLDEKNKVTLIAKKSTLFGKKDSTVSLLPLFQTADGIETKGLYYPLHNGKLTYGISMGISNVFLSDTAEVSVKKGALLAVQSRD